LIPDLPEGMTLEQELAFYSQLEGNLSDQGSVHVNWHTHRRNPSVCWICDRGILTTKILDLYDKFISKSSVDLETSHMSDDETDTEIENEGSLEPEYNIEEETEILDN